MTRKKFIIFLVLAAMLVAAVVFVAVGQKQENTPGDVFCYTRDRDGNLIRGFENQGQWYLFVPSSQSVADITLLCNAELIQASSGTLAEDGMSVSGAFRAKGDSVVLTDAAGVSRTVTVMQSQLPSVRIYLENTSLEELHSEKMTLHPGNTVLISTPGGQEDLTAERKVEIRGRGNSSWSLFEKKGYQLKFPSNTSVLGMEPARRWVLLANACDDSLMRNYLVFDMARELDMAFVPEFRYVDLWIDGDYRGNYLLGEKVEVDPNRLNLTQRDGTLYEHDVAFYMDEEYWVRNEVLQRFFTIKDMAEDHTLLKTQALDNLNRDLDELGFFMYNTPSREVTLSQLEEFADLRSFALYYLINDYVQNREAFATSFYWYKDGPQDVLHMGPIWDFDTCMGNDGSPYTETYGEQHVVFAHMLATPVFHEYTKGVFEEIRGQLESMADRIPQVQQMIGDSAAMNYLRWNTLGTPNPKDPAQIFSATFDEAVQNLRDWLLNRRDYFQVPRSVVINSTLSDDCRTLDIIFEDGNAYERLDFSVWSVTRGEEFAVWQPGELVNGRWVCSVDMSQLNFAGFYRIAAHANGDKKHPVAFGKNYAEKAAESLYPISAVFHNGGTALELRMNDQGGCDSVSFAVWSEEDGQDDLQWFDATKGFDEVWSAWVDMSGYEQMGTYFVHAYGKKGEGKSEYLNACTANWEARMQIALIPGGGFIEADMEVAQSFKEVKAAVWNAADAEPQIQWVFAQPDGEGRWVCTIDLSQFPPAQTYNVHFYGVKPQDEELFLGGAAVDVNS